MTGTARSDMHVVVVGGGIAGLMAALCCSRHGYSVTVLERGRARDETPATSTSDYCIGLSPNGTSLLLQQGMDLSALHPFSYNRFLTLSSEGAVINELRIPPTPGPPHILTRRSHVHAQLTRMVTAMPTANILYNQSVQTVQEEEGWCTTQDGQRFEADVFLLSNGIKSHFRSQMEKDSAEVVSHSRNSFSQSVSTADLFDRVPGLKVHFDGEEKSMCPTVFAGAESSGSSRAIQVIIFPNEEGKLCDILCSTFQPEGGDTLFPDGKLTAQNVPPSTVSSFFANWTGLAKEVVDKAGQGHAWGAWKYVDIEVVKRGTLGCAILLGDAAHAMTPHLGQGANLALEDGEAVAWVLRPDQLSLQSSAEERQRSIRAALHKFVDLRLDRVKKIHEQNRFVMLNGRRSFDMQAFRQLTYAYRGAQLAEQAGQGGEGEGPTSAKSSK